MCIDCRCFSTLSRWGEHPGSGRGQGPVGSKVLPVARLFKMVLSWLFFREWISLRCFAIKYSTFPQMGFAMYFHSRYGRPPTPAPARRPGSLCWAWLSGGSSRLTMGGSGAVALKAASLRTAVARLRAFDYRSTLSLCIN